MALSIVPSSPGAEDYAKAETERKIRLFAWADGVLKSTGLAKRISLATTADELRKIVFDPEAAEVALAIQEAVNPASGVKTDHFEGLSKGALKAILKMRFGEMKAEREVQLQSSSPGGTKQRACNWAADLKLDKKDAVLPILTNLILFLTYHPKWKGVFAYDEFAALVVIRKRPPWGEVAPDTPCTDHHESLTRVWFQREDINAKVEDLGRALSMSCAHWNCRRHRTGRSIGRTSTRVVVQPAATPTRSLLHTVVMATALSSISCVASLVRSIPRK